MQRCPTCGLDIQDANTTVCPRCGQPLPTAQPPNQYNPYGNAPYGSAPTAQESYGQYGQYGPYGQPAAPSQSPYGQPPSYGQPANPYGQPAQPSVPMYGQTTPGAPTYGQPGAPSQGFPPAYGQPGAPSQGYPPAYGQPGAPTYGGPGGSPFTTPPKKSPLPLILGILGGIILLAIIAGGALYAIGKGNGTAQNNSNPTATTGTTGPAPTATSSAQVLINDPLTSDTGQWANDSHCTIKPDGYHIKDNYECFAPVQTPANFDMKVTVSQAAGNNTDPSGMLWHADEQGVEYDFVIYGDGDWTVLKCTSLSSCNPIVSSRASSAIHQGLNQKNTIEVQATGSHFVFLINGTQVGQVNDSSLTATHCGLFAGGSVEAVFTNFIITVPNS